MVSSLLRSRSTREGTSSSPACRVALTELGPRQVLSSPDPQLISTDCSQSHGRVRLPSGHTPGLRAGHVGGGSVLLESQVPSSLNRWVVDL